jgi:hypothetical protein
MKITELPNGRALCEFADGDKRWYLNIDLVIIHREDGPAVENINGDKYWCLNGKYHRTDGPAVEHANGTKWWFLNGMQIHCTNQKEFEQLMRLMAFW